MAWPEIGVFVVLVLAAQGLGRPAAARLSLEDGLSRFVWAQALGLAGLIGLAGGLSLLGWLRPWPVGLVLAGLACSCLAWLRPRSWRLGGLADLSGWERLFLAGIGLHLTLSLAQALAPPTWGEGLHFLFVYARDYGREGAVYYHPDVYASRPQNMVLLFSLVQLFARAEASQLLSWWFGLLSVLAVVAMGRRELDRPTGLLAGLILAAMPLVGELSGRGMSDLGVLFFGLMGCWATWLALKTARARSFAALAGLSLGLAAGFKVIGLMVLAVGLAALLLAGLWRKIGPVPLALALGLGLAAACPWYVYSQAHTGQVFYRGAPIEGRLQAEDRARFFGGQSAQAEAPAQPLPRVEKDRRRSSLGPAGLAGQVLSLARRRFLEMGLNPLTSIWRLNLMGDRNQRAVGPLVLMLAPLLVLIRPVPRALRWLVLLGLAQVALAPQFLGPYTRYALVGLGLGGLGAAWVWWSLVRLGPWSRRAAVLALALAWIPLLPQAGYNFCRDVPVSLGLQDRRVYLAGAFPDQALEVYDWANRYLPPGARVMLIGEHRPYFLERDFLYGTPGRNPLLPYPRLRGPADLERAMAALKVSHVLLNRSLSDSTWNPRWGNIPLYFSWFDSLEGASLKPLFRRGMLTLYRFDPARGQG